ncbi:carboxypeptidase N subunit 2-like [Chlorella sorokiniana]|uniref:Carboxypeptidase N subunit 2-like n=1 Tax=Chlorella sorokiniana TaxID=3076 RepID=A0A2P6TH28_CHLSO|nr:carboxypeptidase N subunit 2-like [Chlorella sorokiniana]|eukprot:PRW33566.1 carboxypeptidase N subunit 2-like [Chlorella sorokiniana]
MSGGPHTPTTIGHLPDELLSRIWVAAATKQTDGASSIDLRLVGPLSRLIPGQRQRWLHGKLRLLTRVGPLVQHLRVVDDSVAQGMVEPLLRAAPCTLRSLSLQTRWGPHLSQLPAFLALENGCCASLARFELSAQERAGSFDPAAHPLALPGPTAGRLEAQLLADLIASVAGLAGSLVELKLSLKCVELPSLAPLAALRRLRRLEVAGVSCRVEQPAPVPAQFPCLEEYDLRGIVRMQVAGAAIRQASWVAEPLCTLRLYCPDPAALPALLAALRPPAAGPLERLCIDYIHLAGDASPAVAAVHACVQHLDCVRELSIHDSTTVPPLLEPLLRQLPRLETLQLTNCKLTALPVGPYLSGLHTLSLAGNSWTELPPAVLLAPRLQYLSLQGSRGLCPSEAVLRQLLHALPELQRLDLSDTSIGKGVAEALQAAAAARGGLTVELPEFQEAEDPWRLDNTAGYGSSDSDSSDDGCPRYSWAGCAYASRW